MELSEFKQNIIDEIKFAASTEGTTDKEEFINYTTNALMEAEEIEDFTPLHFEGLGKNNRRIQVDGYYHNELEDCLSLFIVPSLTYISRETLTNTDAEKLFARARVFLEDASYIKASAEPSAEGFGLAVDILGKYADVRKYVIYLLTDMEMSKSIKELNAPTLHGKPVEYHIWDIGRLYQLQKSSVGKEDIVIDLNEMFGKGIPCLAASSTDDYTAYLCNIPGRILANLYNTYGGRLLEGNVRSFLQTKGKVNKGIRNTILNDPTMFFAYNNGIAATASEAAIEDREGMKYITKITSLQIVNGGQTTASLAMALLNDKGDGSEEKIQKIFVPMKLSIVSHENAQELIPNISRYANSQNKVSDADLWSNHPFHIRMEEFSRRIVAPATQGRQYGTHWFYERANGQYKQETYKCTPSEKKRFELQNPSSQMFKKVDLARFVNLRQMRPDIASTGGQKGFARFATWVVKQWENNNSAFNEEFFKEIVALAVICKEADKIVRTQTWYNSYKANIVAYTISKLFYTVDTEYPDCAISLKNIWSRQQLSQAWVKQIETISELMYEHLIEESRPVENVTEWAKREMCWEKAKEIKVLLNKDFVAELTDKTIEQEEKRYAKKDQRLNDKLDAMVKVVNFGVDNWKALLEWDKTHRVLSYIDQEFVKTAIAVENGRIPTEKQAVRILQVLDKARSESFPLSL
jgi:hypothetical protein